MYDIARVGLASKVNRGNGFAAGCEAALGAAVEFDNRHLAIGNRQ